MTLSKKPLTPRPIMKGRYSHKDPALGLSTAANAALLIGLLYLALRLWAWWHPGA